MGIAFTAFGSLPHSSCAWVFVFGYPVDIAVAIHGLCYLFAEHCAPVVETEPSFQQSSRNAYSVLGYLSKYLICMRSFISLLLAMSLCVGFAILHGGTCVSFCCALTPHCCLAISSIAVMLRCTSTPHCCWAISSSFMMLRCSVFFSTSFLL